MFPTRLAFAGALLLLSAVPALAQPYVRGAYMGSPRAGFPYAARPFPSAAPGADLGLRATGAQLNYAVGYGSDYSGNYYRPTYDLGYYYLGFYYPDTSGVNLRTPLSPPPPDAVPTPNLTAYSPSSPNFTYPDLINPAMNPTIRPRK